MKSKTKYFLLIASLGMVLSGAIGFLYYYTNSDRVVTITHVKRLSNPSPVVAKIPLNWLGHWLNEDERETMVREVAKEFSTRNPDIDLNLNFPQNILGYKNKRDSAKMYVEMIKNKTYSWDVIWLDDQIYQFVADELNDSEWGKKYLVNFGDVPGFREAHKDFIFDDPIWANQTSNIIVGPMLEGYLHAIFFNKPLADKIGLTIKEEGMTFDDLLGYVKKVYEYNQKNNDHIAAFYESSDWTCQEILFQRLLRSEIGDFNKTLDLSGSPEKNLAFKKTLEALEELGKYKPLYKEWKNSIWFNTRQVPLNDEALFYVNGVWMYNHWMSIDPEKIKKMIPAELPVFKEVDFYQGGYIPTWAVWKDAPNRDAAVKLMQFWARPQIAEKWTRSTMAPTGIKGNVSTGTEGDNPFNKWQSKMTQKYGGKMYYLASTAYFLGSKGTNGLLLDAVKKEITSLLDGETTAQASYDRIMSKVQ